VKKGKKPQKSSKNAKSAVAGRAGIVPLKSVVEANLRSASWSEVRQKSSTSMTGSIFVTAHKLRKYVEWIAKTNPHVLRKVLSFLGSTFTWSFLDLPRRCCFRCFLITMNASHCLTCPLFLSWRNENFLGDTVIFLRSEIIMENWPLVTDIFVSAVDLLVSLESVSSSG
jgi:hypothetical protein